MNPTLSIHIRAAQDRTVPVYFGPNLLKTLPELLKTHAPAHRYALITDSTVETLYGKKLLEDLNAAGLTTELFSFPAGEAYKNEEIKQGLDHALLKKSYGRDTVIIALGGGVVGDLAGFVAATYLRGIPFVQVPTTVLAMADSSIGGKVGIDTPYGKNMIGAFWQPALIVADTDTLETLSETQQQNGRFEAIKMFVCMDKNAYENFKKGRSAELLQRAMELKIHVVEQDEREAGLRSVLNFGHSVGHALELLSDYTLPHGFAIALGMLVEARISVLMGHLSEGDWQDLFTVLKSNGLSMEWLEKTPFDELWDALQNDKKNREGQVKLVMLKALGAVVESNNTLLHTVEKTDLENAWKNTLAQVA